MDFCMPSVMDLEELGLRIRILISSWELMVTAGGTGGERGERGE